MSDETRPGYDEARVAIVAAMDEIGCMDLSDSAADDFAAAAYPVIAAAVERATREKIRAGIEGQRIRMPDTDNVAALAGWVMSDQARIDAARIAAGIGDHK